MTARRLGSFGVLGVLVMALGFYFIHPLWRTERDYVLWRGKAVRAIAGYQALNAHQAAFESAFKSLQNTPLWSRLYVARDRPSAEAAIGADIQRLFAQIAISASWASVVDQNAGVTIDCTFTTTIDRLQALLQTIDTHGTYLQVTALEVNAPSVQDRAVNAPLTIRLSLRGYWRRETPT